MGNKVFKALTAVQQQLRGFCRKGKEKWQYAPFRR